MSACDRCLAWSELTVALAAIARLSEGAAGTTPAELIAAAEGAGKDRIASVRRSWSGWSADAVARRGARGGTHATLPLRRSVPRDAAPARRPTAGGLVRGNEALLAGCPDLAAGIVGTRRPTLTGRDAARRFAATLARAEGIVVSGMALGIDAAAHEGALSVGGATIAVLASGADVATPTSHRALYARILERGLVVAELPPGTRPFRWSFPARNRVIAALSAVTVVVEAPARSGALITATHATDLGREVCAVPGSLASDTCAGSNRLLVDGAGAVVDGADLTAALGLTPKAGAAAPGGPGGIVHATLQRRPLSLARSSAPRLRSGPARWNWRCSTSSWADGRATA